MDPLEQWTDRHPVIAYICGIPFLLIVGLTFVAALGLVTGILTWLGHLL